MTTPTTLRSPNRPQDAAGQTEAEEPQVTFPLLRRTTVRELADHGTRTGDVIERLTAEGLIDLPTAATLLPYVSGHPTGIGTMWRYCTRGKAGVRLEAFRFRDEWWTSKAAVGRFLAACVANS
jgi:hypothetical protein